MKLDARLIKRFAAQRDSAAFELNVHLRVETGITVLFGPSGAGKSLTLNCLAGFARPDEGRILVNDQLYFDAAAGVHLTPQERRCGYIFQDHALFPHMTVRDNLRFSASVARSGTQRKRERHKRIRELLEGFELADLAERKPAQLSGGQKQRAALARVLVGEPQLLLLDEPTRGLDARLRQSFYALLRQTRERLEIPAILVTHDLDECFELADFVCLAAGGRFLQAGPKEEVFSKPASVEIARSLGIYNIVPAEIVALDPGHGTSTLTVLNQRIRGPYLPGHLLGDRGYLCVRQGETKVVPAGAKSSNSRNENDVVVRVLDAQISPNGIRLVCEDDIVAAVSNSEYEQIRGNERVRLEIAPEAICFLSAEATKAEP